MITVPGLAAEALGSFLTMHMGRRFGATHANLIALIPSAARLALECIGNSDALYHDVEHTMLAGVDRAEPCAAARWTSYSDCWASDRPYFGLRRLKIGEVRHAGQ